MRSDSAIFSLIDTVLAVPLAPPLDEFSWNECRSRHELLGQRCLLHRHVIWPAEDCEKEMVMIPLAGMYFALVLSKPGQASRLWSKAGNGLTTLPIKSRERHSIR